MSKPEERKGAQYQVQKITDPTLWRPIMFSRNTALVTIPMEIRDKAKLIDQYNNDLGIVFEFNQQAQTLVLHLGQPRPKRTPKKIKEK